MKARTIMIFPDFKNMELIDNIRNQYDPLAKLVRPHITLVFPFKSDFTDTDISNELNDKLNYMKSFPLQLRGIDKHVDRFGNYLFLNVKNGQKQLVEIHNKLYSGILQKYKNSGEYIPHMTIGKLPSEKLMNEAFEEISDLNVDFETVVDKISVEVIGENGESIIETEYFLE